MSTFPTPEEFLAEANVAILATVDRQGRPHAAPIWYLYEDGALVISTGRGSQKHRNIEANPEVTLVVDRRTLPYYAVMVQRASGDRAAADGGAAAARWRCDTWAMSWAGGTWSARRAANR